MGVMPVRQLLITMSLPMMISMLVQALYNVVDSMFVSYISEYALTAVGLAFPAQNLMISVGVGTGVGVNALLSKSLGEKNFDAANKAAVNGIFLAFCSWAAFALLGGFFSRTFMALQTDVPEIIAYGDTYLTIIAVASVGMMFQICFERLLQSTGKTIYTMLSQGLGAVINLILDPLLIFGLGPFPAMGIAGAALATVIGQCVGALLGLFCNLRRNPEITISFRGFRPHGVTIRKIYAVGVPSIIMSSIGSVMTFGMNKILGAFNSTAVAVFSAYFKLESFIFMPVFGLNNGIVPIIAYNYGARKPDRIRAAAKLGFLYGAAIMAVGVLLFWLHPRPAPRHLQRLRLYAGDRHPRPAPHQPQLPARRLRHRYLLGLSGPGPRRTEPHRLRAAAVGAHFARLLAVGPLCRPQRRVGGFPLCGGLLLPAQCGVYGLHVQNRGPSPGAARTLTQKEPRVRRGALF